MFPPLEPFKSGYLAVDSEQSIYWELSGNPAGKPALFLHGGPGAGNLLTAFNEREGFRPQVELQLKLKTADNTPLVVYEVPSAWVGEGFTVSGSESFHFSFKEKNQVDGEGNLLRRTCLLEFTDDDKDRTWLVVNLSSGMTLAQGKAGNALVPVFQENVPSPGVSLSASPAARVE